MSRARTVEYECLTCRVGDPANNEPVRWIATEVLDDGDGWQPYDSFAVQCPQCEEPGQLR